MGYLIEGSVTFPPNPLGKVKFPPSMLGSVTFPPLALGKVKLPYFEPDEDLPDVEALYEDGAPLLFEDGTPVYL